MESSKIIFIIPTYNERENIINLAFAIFKYMPGASILVVDDNSPDGTAESVMKASSDYPNLILYSRTENRGFGRSYVDGFKKILTDARYEAIVMMDADFSHNPATAPAMVSQLSRYDVVIGSRYISGGKIENWNWRRKVLSRFANYYARTILDIPICDTTTGFMCFRKSVLNNIALDSIKSDGYAFLVELKYRLIKNGCKFIEYPIIFSERREGQSKMSVKIIWESIWLPWKIKFLK